MMIQKWFRGLLVGVFLVTAQSACRRESTTTPELEKEPKLAARSTELPPEVVQEPAPPTAPTPAPEVSAKAPTPAVSSHPSNEGANESDDGVNVSDSDANARKVTIATLREIGDDLLDRWRSIHSVSAKLTTALTRRADPDREENGTGHRDMLKQGDRTMVRSKLFIRIQAKNTRSDKPAYYLTAERITKVSDGQYLYRRWERHGGDTLIKTWARPPYIQYFGGPPLMRQLLKLRNVKRLDDDLFNGDPVYVLVGTTPDGKTEVTNMIMKETGLLVNRLMKNEAQQAESSVSLSEIKFNVDFPDDHFLYTPPEGVPVQDLTRQTTQSSTSAPAP